MRNIVGPGAIISIRVLGVKHVGILTDTYVDGMPTVISNSFRRGGVVEETWAQFHEGQTSKVEGYFGKLPPAVVTARARTRLGQKWTATSNCEHLVRYAHGVLEESPQLQGITAAALILGLLFWGNS